MTREETIKWLESLKSEIGKSEHRTLWHYAEAIDMAIEALSADTVSRETYHNLVTASNDIDRALREYQDKEENGELVSVVRCKDCSHRVHDEDRGLYYCEMYYGQGDVSDENFCQWGERREP